MLVVQASCAFEIVQLPIYSRLVIIIVIPHYLGPIDTGERKKDQLKNKYFRIDHHRLPEHDMDIK